MDRPLLWLYFILLLSTRNNVQLYVNTANILPAMSDRDVVAAEDLTHVNLARDPAADFADQAYLTYLIPSETDLDLETAFKGLEQGKSISESIEQRESLFFGE